MDKRTFLKNSAILGIGGVVAGSIPGSINAKGKSALGSRPDGFKLPDLGYGYDALEPYIDSLTMETHYTKHHAGYTRKFNAAVEQAGLGDATIKDIFMNVSDQPLSIRNNGGGYFNHKVFWRNLSPKGGGEPSGDLLKAIEKSFGSFDRFREKFTTAAVTRFGSGWAWLINASGKLVVTSTPNQDNPLMDLADVKGYPLLALDVWEHAYYLKYQNRRGDYISAFWNVVNWDNVSERFNKSEKML